MAWSVRPHRRNQTLVKPEQKHQELENSPIKSDPLLVCDMEAKFDKQINIQRYHEWKRSKQTMTTTP